MNFVVAILSIAGALIGIVTLVVEHKKETARRSKFRCPDCGQRMPPPKGMEKWSAGGTCLHCGCKVDGHCRKIKGR